MLETLDAERPVGNPCDGTSDFHGTGWRLPETDLGAPKPEATADGSGVKRREDAARPSMSELIGGT
jgi:hypothetical protein